jgi:hypothetical protein
MSKGFAGSCKLDEFRVQFSQDVDASLLSEVFGEALGNGFVEWLEKPCQIPGSLNGEGGPSGFETLLFSSKSRYNSSLTGEGNPVGFEHCKQKQNTHEKPRGCSVLLWMKCDKAKGAATSWQISAPIHTANALPR